MKNDNRILINQRFDKPKAGLMTDTNDQHEQSPAPTKGSKRSLFRMFWITTVVGICLPIAVSLASRSEEIWAKIVSLLPRI